MNSSPSYGTRRSTDRSASFRARSTWISRKSGFGVPGCFTAHEAGFRAPAPTGGAVRDLPLGGHPVEILIVATNATPEQVRELFRTA